jgi:peptidoglycan/xylan/chitin deacetylase (PgdA/CDA1 family)
MPGLSTAYYQFGSRLKGLPRDIGWRLGLERSRVKKKPGGRILLYHGICRQAPLRFNTLFITERAFEKQLCLYKKYFNILSLDEYYEQRFSRERFNICLTFDDGFANNYKYVLPLLEQYQVPATFFITGIRQAGYDILWNDLLSMAGKYGPPKFSFGKEEFIKQRDHVYRSSGGLSLTHLLRAAGFDRKAEMIKELDPRLSFREKKIDDYWLQLNTGQIRELAASKWVTIGSHGYYHNDLANLTADKVKEEMILSKEYLEKITGKETRSLAFPYGSYTAETVSMAKSCGYSQLLATEFLFPADHTDATMRERLTINPFVSNINQLHANISGHYR